MTQTLYVRPIDRKDLVFQLVRHQRLRADPTGPIEVLDAFWDLGAPIGNETTAPLLLIYADLMSTRDPRNVQTAALVRAQME